MEVLQKSLSHLNAEIANKIDLVANHQSIKETQEKPLCLIGVYGAMLSPSPEQAFFKRAGMTYRRNKLVDTGNDLLKYYLGVYMIPNRKLVFNKIADEQHGFANLILSENNDYAYLSVYAIPKVLLQEGNGALMIAERCEDHDYYNPNNEYVLTNNIHPLVSINNQSVINPLQCYMFLAGFKFINSSLKPFPEYRDKIVEQLQELRDVYKQNISSNYINRIISL